MSSKSPTIKRILKEASELATQPSADYHAAPLESDLFEWHFTLRGPPAPSPYEGGLYHGRIVLPPAYPLKPPSFRFLTATGRFEVNREICLSISGHHEETWQPAWGIRTALVAIRSFMDTDAQGQVGGMDASEEVRRRFAVQSAKSRCAVCGKTNEEIIRELDEAVQATGGEGKNNEVVPEELRLAYREDLSKEGGGGENGGETKATPEQNVVEDVRPLPTRTIPAPASVPAVAPPAVPLLAQRQQPPVRQEEDVPAWIDKAIYGVLIALAFLVWKKYLL